MNESTELKIIIAQAAVKSRMESGPAWSLAEISALSGVPVSEMFKLFPTKRSMLDFWYTSLILRYRAMCQELPEFQELTLSEKLSNFMLSVTDMLGEELEFASQSFDPIVFKNQSWHPFKKETAALLKETIEGHDGVSQSARVFLWDEIFEFLAVEFLHVIKFALRDKSPQKEKTVALVDKFSNFISEILCNRIIDSGLDLLRFFWQEGIIKVDVYVPFVGRIRSGSDNPPKQAT